MGRPANELPGVGQMCLVVKGKAGDDEGQAAIVCRQTASRVEVKYLGPGGNAYKMKLKAPSSLILLEDGLAVKEEDDGSIWIKRVE